MFLTRKHLPTLADTTLSNENYPQGPLGRGEGVRGVTLGCSKRHSYPGSFFIVSLTQPRVIWEEPQVITQIRSACGLVWERPS